MIRTIAAALAAFVFVAFGARAEETKPADAKTEKAPKKAKKGSKKGAKKAPPADAPAAK